MEAARVASLRGHQVRLVEQGADLGGTAVFASIAYRENGPLVDYLKEQVANSSVNVELGTFVDEAYLRRQAPEVVIVATGARRDEP
jgi:2,4-dienoyl-CoA reductase (NADPH2)